MAIGGTKVIQVTNIAPQATKDQMQTLFGYLGKIEDIRLYPTIRDVSCPVQSRICYIKFIDTITVGIAQHMTNTVFIDRALIVIPVQNGEIPDEYFALEMTKNGTIVPGLCPSEPNLPANVVNSISGVGADQVIVTTDPKLEANGLTPYPPLPINYDSHKIEEVRRTVLILNIDSNTTAEDLIDFFIPTCEVKYIRLCTRQSDNSTHMLVEFSEQPSVAEALKMNGKDFKGKPIKIIHATQPIVKPQAKSNEAAQREIEEAMSRVKEAQNLISATIDPVIGMLSKDKRGSRRSRSRSRGRRRRSRSRSRSRRRSRSRHRSRRSRSRSKRSRSKERKRSKTPPRRRSRSGSRSGSRMSRSRRSTSRSRKSRSKSRSSRREKDKRKSRDKEQAKSRDRSKDKKDKDKSRDMDRAKSKDRDKDKERARDKERDSKEKKSDKESSIDFDEKRSNSDKKRMSRSSSRARFRSRSRERKPSRSPRERKRSRSRGSRRRTPSPRVTRRRSRSKSRDGDRKREKREKKEKRDRSPSSSKVPRNYDEEERGFDEKYKRKDSDSYHESDTMNDKESSEKSDNMDISNSP